MKILVTGACGFIGHHVVRAFVDAGHEIIALDRMDETSTMMRLANVANTRFVWHDLRSPINDLVSRMIGPVDAIYHLAASTHVDRSIADGLAFVMDNVVGTAHVMEYARKLPDLKLMLNFSTDEVFGPAPDWVAYKEHDRHDARNPYSATKAGGEELAHAYGNTYGIPVMTTHCMNAFGEGQHPEKFIPLVIRSVLNGDTVPIHVSPEGDAGSRFYIYVKDIGKMMVGILDRTIETGKPPAPKMNIPGVAEVDNLAMAKLIAKHVGEALQYELVDFHSTRPGHDLRYALDGDLCESLGLKDYTSLDDAMRMTVNWYLDHKEWLLL
jgi:dTDP-glucose 4,6-dehydratase